MSKAPRVITAEDQIRLMRGGYDQELKLVFRGLEVPCRVLPALEKQTAISNAVASLKVPMNHDREAFESIVTAKAILKAATTIKGIPNLAGDFLEKVSDKELGGMLEAYNEIEASVEIQFEDLTASELAGIIDALKKKETSWSALSTLQLAAIGRSFLGRALAEDSEPGP